MRDKEGTHQVLRLIRPEARQQQALLGPQEPPGQEPGAQLRMIRITKKNPGSPTNRFERKKREAHWKRRSANWPTPKRRRGESPTTASWRWSWRQAGRWSRSESWSLTRVKKNRIQTSRIRIKKNQIQTSQSWTRSPNPGAWKRNAQIPPYCPAGHMAKPTMR